ncbi:MAG: ABC transporter ATP-binding protein [Blastopirellula sp.]|nr:MAG: ABC transporter ATP-binding protein [Blastopirellula sp.]
MIQIHNLQFAYQAEGFRLRVDELAVKQGEQVAIVGPSGCGKTTLLHLMAGITLPNSGQILSNQTELTALSDAARRNFRIANIGLVLQDFALIDYLNVIDNILLPYRINRSLKLDASVIKTAEQLATDLGIDRFLNQKPATLSQGERQRVAVCRALITSPTLILADEPTANLDPVTSSWVLDVLQKYIDEQQATLIVVSHDQDVIARLNRKVDVSAFSERLEPAGQGGAIE